MSSAAPAIGTGSGGVTPAITGALATAAPAAPVIAPNAFERGLIDALKPAVVTADDAIRSVMHSQQSLGYQLDRLAAAMSVFGETVKLPGLVPYSEKLSNTRKRLVGVGKGLDKINARLEEVRHCS